MPAYESEGFSPPAPIARVVLKNPSTGSECADVPMLIDTGADVTLIPEWVAARIGLETTEDRRYELVGFDGQASAAPVAHARMVLGGRAFNGRFLLHKGACGILGRNILNVLSLVMDGPRLEWRELR